MIKLENYNDYDNAQTVTWTVEFKDGTTEQYQGTAASLQYEFLSHRRPGTQFDTKGANSKTKSNDFERYAKEIETYCGHIVKSVKFN